MQGACTLPLDRGMQPRKADRKAVQASASLLLHTLTPQTRCPGRSSSPYLVLVEGAEVQQVLDILAREAQGLPYARAGQDAVLDEAVNRRGVHLQVSGQVLDREQQLESQTLSSLASCESLLFWLFGMPADRYSAATAIVPDPRQLM